MAKILAVQPYQKGLVEGRPSCLCCGYWFAFWGNYIDCYSPEDRIYLGWV